MANELRAASGFNFVASNRFTANPAHGSNRHRCQHESAIEAAALNCPFLPQGAVIANSVQFLSWCLYFVVHPAGVQSLEASGPSMYSRTSSRALCSRLLTALAGSPNRSAMVISSKSRSSTVLR